MLSRGRVVGVVAVLAGFGGGLLAGGPAWALIAGTALLLVVLTVGWRVLARSDRRAEEQLHELRRAMHREKVLGDLGAGLLSSTDPAQVHRLATGAAESLLRDYEGARATVLHAVPAPRESEPERRAARSGRPKLSLVGPDGVVPGSVVPGSVTPGSVTPGSVTPGSVTPRAAGSEAAAPGSIVLPLRAGDRDLGVLTVTAPGELPADLLGALQAVQVQAALALDNARLSAEVHRGMHEDPLTGLHNRAMLRERLSAALSRSRRHGRPVGVLLLDLGGFRQVNDVHGHDAGDELLRVVAGRVRDCVRLEDVVGRLGGDQFAVIAEDLRTAQDVVLIAERIVASLEKAMPVSGRMVRTPASVGIALSHPDTEGPDDVLRAAEAAMSAAKQRGGARYQLHGSTAPA